MKKFIIILTIIMAIFATRFVLIENGIIYTRTVETITGSDGQDYTIVNRWKMVDGEKVLMMSTAYHK